MRVELDSKLLNPYYLKLAILKSKSRGVVSPSSNCLVASNRIFYTCTDSIQKCLLNKKGVKIKFTDTNQVRKLKDMLLFQLTNENIICIENIDEFIENYSDIDVIFGSNELILDFSRTQLYTLLQEKCSEILKKALKEVVIDKALETYKTADVITTIKEKTTDPRPLKLARAIGFCEHCIFYMLLTKFDTFDMWYSCNYIRIEREASITSKPFYQEHLVLNNIPDICERFNTVCTALTKSLALYGYLDEYELVAVPVEIDISIYDEGMLKKARGSFIMIGTSRKVEMDIGLLIFVDLYKILDIVRKIKAPI